MADLLCKTVKIVVLAMSSRVAYPLLLRELGDCRYGRKIKKLEEELDKKLDEAEREFRREAAKLMRSAASWRPR